MGSSQTYTYWRSCINSINLNPAQIVILLYPFKSNYSMSTYDIIWSYILIKKNNYLLLGTLTNL